MPGHRGAPLGNHNAAGPHRHRGGPKKPRVHKPRAAHKPRKPKKPKG